MKWLLTTAADYDLGELADQLAELNASLDDEPLVPLHPDEQVLSAQGPPDLPQRLVTARLPIRAYRNSDIELY